MKKIISYLLASILLISVTLSFVGCKTKPEDYTVEEHIERISKRIEERDSTWGYPDGESYEDFSVYPLYDQNEELQFFLVEFEPYGFVFIDLVDELILRSIIQRGNVSMYGLSGWCELSWSPYINNGKSQSYSDREWILDENGQKISYDKSPYFVTNNINERKYFWESSSGTEYICAVKKNGVFINLISGKEIDLSDKNSYKSQETFYIYFLYHKVSKLYL